MGWTLESERFENSDCDSRSLRIQQARIEPLSSLSIRPPSIPMPPKSAQRTGGFAPGKYGKFATSIEYRPPGPDQISSTHSLSEMQLGGPRSARAAVCLLA